MTQYVAFCLPLSLSRSIFQIRCVKNRKYIEKKKKNRLTTIYYYRGVRKGRLFDSRIRSHGTISATYVVIIFHIRPRIMDIARRRSVRVYRIIAIAYPQHQWFSTRVTWIEWCRGVDTKSYGKTIQI